MRFKKIKFDGDTVVLHWTTELGATVTHHELESEEAPHPDFDNALQALVDDVRRICELPIAYEEGLRVQSVSFSYSEKTGASGAVVTALKSLAAATSPLVLNTPHLLTEGETGAMPPGMAIRLEELEMEAIRFRDGKREQGDLFGAGEKSGIDSITLRFGDTEVTATPEEMRSALDELAHSRGTR